MSSLASGLLLTLLFYGLLLLVLMAAVLMFPKSILGRPARAALNWLPPFLGGAALREWATAAGETLARKRLAQGGAGAMPVRLAAEMEEGAMRAMLPFVEPDDLERVVACPEAGQGRIGVTAPEALAMADYIRQHKSAAEQKRICEQAAENARKIAVRGEDCIHASAFPCALQGKDHVCCIYAMRPLRCRPLHAIAIAKEGGRPASVGSFATQPGDANRHEQIVAEGIELGVAQALQTAGLDGKIYELNSALAVALTMPDAAERWARGERVFRDPIA